MNRIKQFTSMTMLQTVKWVLYKLAPLSVVALFAATANAGTCPDMDATFFQYVKNDNELVKDNQKNPDSDWKLSWNYLHQPFTLFKGKSIKTVSVKATTWANAEDPTSLTIDTVTCEYKDAGNLYPDISLFLTATSKGRLIPSDNSNWVNATRIDRYVSSGGVIEGSNWDNNAPKDEMGFPIEGVPVTEYFCSDLTKCGQFSFEKVIQDNGFWSNARYWCRSIWGPCKNEGTYVDRINKLDNSAEVRRTLYGLPCHENTVVCKTEPNKNALKCDEPLCKREIREMFNIIGPFSNDQGMARYLTMCWAGQEWQYKQWKEQYKSETRNCNSEGLTSEAKSWPSYAHFGITDPWYNKP